MSKLLFRDDAYLRDAPATVIGHTEEGGIVLDASLFYPTGGGQPGDSGWVAWDGGRLAIATAVKAGDDVALVPAEATGMPAIGTPVLQELDWDRRFRHMRMHTALHLLSVVLPYPVTGGAIGAQKGRLDFQMPDMPSTRDTAEARLNALIDRDLPVTDGWITDEELAERPELVKTMSVSPPRGQGRVRLVRIGQGADQVDLQPCGGTHVSRTGEIGAIKLGKFENKGKSNRRVSVTFDE